jgi:TonB family protein
MDSMDDEIHLLLNQFVDERAIHRKREAVLISIIAHLLFVILIILAPRLFPNGLWRNPPVRDLTSLDASKKLGLLAPPKDYQKFLQRPKSPVLSDSDRSALGKPPLINPRARAPHSRGETKLPEQSAPRATPEPPRPPTVASAANPSVQDLQPKSGASKGEAPQDAAKMQAPSSPDRNGETKTNLRDLFAGLQTPGSSIQSSLEKARQGGGYGSGGSGAGESLHRLDNRQPNFSVDQPTILSDTQGVDFGPWLRLIYFRVKDNWYAVIPELIRSGTQAKVVVIFDVKSNGRIENVQISRSSGLPPYDRAAISSLKLSEPFPNFPVSFSGDHLTLQFSYFYNIKL